MKNKYARKYFLQSIKLLITVYTLHIVNAICSRLLFTVKRRSLHGEMNILRLSSNIAQQYGKPKVYFRKVFTIFITSYVES